MSISYAVISTRKSPLDGDQFSSGDRRTPIRGSRSTGRFRKILTMQLRRKMNLLATITVGLCLIISGSATSAAEDSHTTKARFHIALRHVFERADFKSCWDKVWNKFDGSSKGGPIMGNSSGFIAALFARFSKTNPNLEHAPMYALVTKQRGTNEPHYHCFNMSDKHEITDTLGQVMFEKGGPHEDGYKYIPAPELSSLVQLPLQYPDPETGLTHTYTKNGWFRHLAEAVVAEYTKYTKIGSLRMLKQLNPGAITYIDELLRKDEVNEALLIKMIADRKNWKTYNECTGISIEKYEDDKEFRDTYGSIVDCLERFFRMEYTNLTGQDGQLTSFQNLDKKAFQKELKAATKKTNKWNLRHFPFQFRNTGRGRSHSQSSSRSSSRSGSQSRSRSRSSSSGKKPKSKKGKQGK